MKIRLERDGTVFEYKFEPLERLTAAQKCSVIMAVIACTAFLGFMYLVTRMCI